VPRMKAFFNFIDRNLELALILMRERSNGGSFGELIPPGSSRFSLTTWPPTCEA